MISQIIDETYNRPWLIFVECNRLLTTVLSRIYFYISGIKVGRRSKFYGIPRALKYRGSKISIGDNFESRNTLFSNALTIEHPLVLATVSSRAKIIIGNHVGISGGNIVSAEKIEIGDYTMIGANCVIIDTDFHPLAPTKRRYLRNKGKSEPIHIGSNVFIGTKTIILRGVTIGKNSVIGAGSIVRKSIPENSIYVDGKVRKLK